MLLGLDRVAMAGGKKYTAADYKGDIVTMWDAIENVSMGGAHDSTTTTWHDIVGSNNISLTMGDGYWNVDSLRLAKSTKTTGSFTANKTYKFIEVVMKELTNDLLYGRNILLNFGDSYHYFVVATNWGSSSFGIGFCGNNDANYPMFHYLSDYSNIPFCAACAYGSDNRALPDEMYWNGEQEDANGNTIVMGQYTGLQVYGSYQADSLLYAVRLHSRKLTADEVAANYAIDKARFNLT